MRTCDLTDIESYTGNKDVIIVRLVKPRTPNSQYCVALDPDLIESSRESTSVDDLRTQGNPVLVVPRDRATLEIIFEIPPFKEGLQDVPPSRVFLFNKSGLREVDAIPSASGNSASSVSNLHNVFVSGHGVVLIDGLPRGEVMCRPGVVILYPADDGIYVLGFCYYHGKNVDSRKLIDELQANSKLPNNVKDKLLATMVAYVG